MPLFHHEIQQIPPPDFRSDTADPVMERKYITLDDARTFLLDQAAFDTEELKDRASDPSLLAWELLGAGNDTVVVLAERNLEAGGLEKLCAEKQGREIRFFIARP